MDNGDHSAASDDLHVHTQVLMTALSQWAMQTRGNSFFSTEIGEQHMYCAQQMVDTEVIIAKAHGGTWMMHGILLRRSIRKGIRVPLLSLMFGCFGRNWSSFPAWPLNDNVSLFRLHFPSRYRRKTPVRHRHLSSGCSPACLVFQSLLGRWFIALPLAENRPFLSA